LIRHGFCPSAVPVFRQGRAPFFIGFASFPAALALGDPFNGRSSSLPHLLKGILLHTKEGGGRTGPAAPVPGKERRGAFWRQADRRPGRNKKNRRRAGQTAPAQSPAKRRKWDGPRPGCRKKAANGSGQDRSKRDGKRPANPGPPFSPGRRKAGTRKRMGKAEAKRPVPVLP